MVLLSKMKNAKVLIVGKTWAKSMHCVGGITRQGESLRLKPPGFDFWSADEGLEIGQEYQLKYMKVKNSENPHHVEDARVYSKKLIKELSTEEIAEWLREEDLVVISDDPLDVFNFDGNEHPMIRDTEKNYITSPKSQVSRLKNSVGFWECSGNLTMCRHGDYGIYYYNDDLKVNIKYVGLATPIQSIKAGQIIRLSTAGLWSPSDSNQEPVSYLQLSGWF